MVKTSAYKAYTLIEILIVISIIGLMMGIGVLQYRDYARRQSLTAASRTMVSNLKLVQEYALSGKKPASGCVNLDGYRLKIVPPMYMIHAMCDGVDGPKVGDNILSPADISFSAGEVIFKVLGQGTTLGAGGLTIKVTQTSTGKFQNIVISQGGVITWP